MDNISVYREFYCAWCGEDITTEQSMVSHQHTSIRGTVRVVRYHYDCIKSSVTDGKE